MHFCNKLDQVGNTSIVLKMEKTNILGDRLPYNGPSFYVAHLLRLTIWSDGGCADVLATSSDGRMLKLFFLTGFKRPRPVDGATHVFKDSENDGFVENVANGLFLKKVEKVLRTAGLQHIQGCCCREVPPY